MKRVPLTELDILEIVRLAEEGMTQREISVRFGRSVVQIGRYIRGESGTALNKSVQMKNTGERLKIMSDAVQQVRAKVQEQQGETIESYLEFIKNQPKSDTPQHIIDKAKELGGR